ncbi:Xylose isomerase-like TIM barrel [Pirellulimonas nuda]|uniref:Xylose isomerase-like TIM barrel n=1 Tax=Pirellulimonas nuda TaxID=2528009 RepID=A0A518DAI7_9BACT|nr:TIM barrel protein [Pirellulimonas nuda]QDU88436.1 Xylose isomerase-like TIM barrel [Pirellulimonas nuda]
MSDIKHLSILGHGLDRRAFLGRSLAAAAAVGMSGRLVGAAPVSAKRPPVCAFIKFVQSLSYDDMAAGIAEIGFDGIESTVREGGHVQPERVEDDLPKQLEAVKKQGMDITIMCTDVLGLDQPLTEKVLRTGASLGIKKYRMGFYRYDPKRGVMEQLSEIRPRLKELAALNRELGLAAVYQNHSGADFVGAPIWDLRMLLEGIPTSEVGSAFDIRHATVEAGLAWPLNYDVIKPHIGAVFAKDFVWDGKKAKHVPLGQGRVDPEFFTMHLNSGIDCPVSLHVEYLGEGDAQENMAALKRDYGVLSKWLKR